MNGTFQVCFHGRGGQGVVTSAEILAAAAFAEGREAQAFPTFGSERTGAPVVSYCRISDTAIRTHEPIDRPDAVVVQDPTLLGHVDVLAGLREDGLVIVSTARRPEELALAGPPGLRVLTVPAAEIGSRHIGRPLPGTALLGAFAAASGIVGPEALADVVRARFAGAVGERNADAVAEGHSVAAREVGARA